MLRWLEKHNIFAMYKLEGSEKIVATTTSKSVGSDIVLE